MNVRAVIGIVAFSIGMAALVTSGHFMMSMIRAINQNKGAAESISFIGSTPAKTVRIFNEYRSMYPSGRLHLYALAAFAVQVLAFVLVAVCLSIIGNPAR
jgi:hypothetical protein